MGKRVLLVEGKDDVHVVSNLLMVREIPNVFKVECPESDQGAEENGGIEKLLDAIPRRLLESDLERLGVVVDANDKGPKVRWDQIRSRLVSKGYRDVPEDLPEGGIVELSLRPQTPRSIRLALWVMPDNHSTGMLEDFVVSLIPDHDEMRSPVDSFLASIPRDNRRFPPQHRPKAWIHSWLAVSERPGQPMGQAIKAGRNLDANSPEVEPFLDWLTAVLITDGEQP
jgi:hypothetical protein